MAHLWSLGTAGWGARKLDGTQFDFAASRNPRPANSPKAPARQKTARLIRADAYGSQQWALIAPRSSDVRLNSCAVPAGLCVLADRDEIRIGSEVTYFSTEMLAAIEEFPGGDRQVFCGRCRQLIESGSPSVRCPGCGIWYDESAELPCWTYSGKCTFCGNPTALNSGFSWTPED